jgi:hypothetical protein
MLTIVIETDNAAFEDSPGAELARILREVADKLARHSEVQPGDSFKLRDLNGNTVGKADFT